MASTGPTASSVRYLSVTIVAISMMVSVCVQSQVISRSIQIRLVDRYGAVSGMSSRPKVIGTAVVYMAGECKAACLAAYFANDC